MAALARVAAVYLGCGEHRSRRLPVAQADLDVERIADAHQGLDVDAPLAVLGGTRTLPGALAGEGQPYLIGRLAGWSHG